MTSRSWTRSYLDSEAAALTEPRARATLELLGGLGGLGGLAPHEPAAEPEVPAGPGRIGIWSAQRDSGGETTFTRTSDALGQWGFWANVHRIAPKRQRRRVVLLGESAARGFLYDPAFNVAKALQVMLDSVFGRGHIDVVDLARLGLGPAGLRAIAGAAPALDPDVVVVYAGNNWRNGPVAGLSSARRVARAGALREAGLPALKQQCERELAEDVGAMLRLLATTFAPILVPVVVVVPEVNLADWQDLDTAPGWLGGNRTAAWWSLHAELGRAERAGDAAALGSLSSQLGDLDQGTCALSRLALARYHRAVGSATGELRSSLEAARDASIWNPRVLPSRTLTVMQDALRAESARLGLHVVDLPAQLARDHAGLPDRRLFLDNCHLSHDGIRAAAAAIVSTIAALLGRSPAPPDLVRDVPLDVTSAIEATAHFAAAIVNAHWGQNGNVVRFHCQRALDRHPSIASAIDDYMELAVRRAPGWMCAALERLASQHDRLALTTLVIGNLARQPKLMDRELLDIMAGILGPEVERRLEELRCAEYGGAGTRTALHEPCFALHTMGEREADALAHDLPDSPDLFRAYTPASLFSLVEDRPRAVRLQLCARLDADQPEGELVVSVNGDEVLRAAVGHAWRTWDVNVAPAALRRGINTVEVRWPRALLERGKLERAIDQLARGHRPDLFPIFGEIHSLWATNA